MTPEEAKNLIENTAELNTTYLGSRQSRIDSTLEENIELEDTKRVLNVLNIGPIGYGKTQLMAHAILQDIWKGYGVAVVNPKGGLIDQLIAKMPEERHDDIIYINPARDEVTPINVLDAPTTEDMSMAQLENQKEIIVSDLIALFKRYSENWGDRFGRVIETLLRAHLDLNIYHGETNTLLDVFNAAVNKDVLGELVDRTQDDVLHEELVTIKDELTDREMEPAVRRLKDFVENKTVKRVINAGESGVDFRQAVDDGKIVLVDIQKGEIGTNPAQLIGTIAITSIWAAVQSRITVPEDEREPFYLYVDELQNFAQEGSNLKHVLAECREYGMGLWIASQYLNQLSSDMRRAVTNNCRTKIFFNPSGSEDIAAITGMLRGVSREELTALGKYRAVVQRPSEGNYDGATFFDTYPPFDGELPPEKVEEVKEAATNPGDSREITINRGKGKDDEKKDDRSTPEHTQLLKEAKQYLEFEDDVQVSIVDQDSSSKPDARIIGDDGVAHLEAEHSTLSKPEKVLKNLQRAVEQDRQCVFIVMESNVERLEDILRDVDDGHYRILVVTDLGVIQP